MFAPFQSVNLSAAALLAMAVAAPASGQEADQAFALPETVQFHGFLGQRLTHTDHNDFFGRTEGRLSAETTELGANVSWRLHPAWLVSAQATSRRSGESYDGDVEVDYSFIGWTPVDAGDTRVMARLGQLKLPYGLSNETRDTPGTRQGIILSQGIYFDAMRAYNQKTPMGLNLEAEQTIGDGSLALNWTRGKPTTSDKNAELYVFGREEQGRFHGKNAQLVRLLYDHRGGLVRIGLSLAKGTIGYAPGTGELWPLAVPGIGTVQASPLDGRIEFAHRIVSAQYNTERWSLTLESNRSQTNLFSTLFHQALGTHASEVRKDGTHWYLEGIWRFTPRWEALLRYDKGYDDRAAKSDWTKTSIDRTIGIRHRPDSRWLLSGEFHAVDGVSWLPPADNMRNGVFSPGALSRRWNLLMFQVSRQF